MNSYHEAILKATDNGRLMEYGDDWRFFHSYATFQGLDPNFDIGPDSDPDLGFDIDSWLDTPLGDSVPFEPALSCATRNEELRDSAGSKSLVTS